MKIKQWHWALIWMVVAFVIYCISVAVRGRGDGPKRRYFMIGYYAKNETNNVWGWYYSDGKMQPVDTFISRIQNQYVCKDLFFKPSEVMITGMFEFKDSNDYKIFRNEDVKRPFGECPIPTGTTLGITPPKRSTGTVNSMSTTPMLSFTIQDVDTIIPWWRKNLSDAIKLRGHETSSHNAYDTTWPKISYDTIRVRVVFDDGIVFGIGIGYAAIKYTKHAPPPNCKCIGRIIADTTFLDKNKKQIDESYTIKIID